MWQEKGNSLTQEFTFPDFNLALAFVNKVGECAEKANHHPNVYLSWGKVRITLTTHDAGGVTDKDHELARAIDALG